MRSFAIEAKACAGFPAEAESFHGPVRFGWDGWMGATRAESIDMAMTLDAIAAGSRQGISIKIER
ncbi:hypothetical protein [Variovorax sp. E3]|uniref:hypothetical protein n=1 Tax=Variovorax sp. E3 TaxID=1914993 RepID=UPI0018DBE7CE|nr:hypothetical protein [Variovorax sp. E3]